MRWSFLIFFLALGCYKIPDDLLEEIPQELSLSHSLESALASEQFQEGPWPNSNWWEWFSDPQLSELIEEGLENNPDILKAESRISGASAIAKQMKAKLFPYINFFFQDNYEHLSAHGFEREFAFHAPAPNVTPPNLQNINWTIFSTPVPAVLHVLDIGFNLDWSLDFFGKNRHQWAAALGEGRALEAEAKQMRLIIGSQIAQAYFSLQTHRAVVDIYQKLIDRKKNLDMLTEQRKNNGIDTKFNTLSSLIDVSLAEKSVAVYEELVELDIHRLLILMGKSPDQEEEITFTFSPLSSQLAIPKEISSNLLARRPDLMAEIWRVEKAASNIKVAKAAFYPEINLQGLLSLRSVFPDQLFSLSPSSVADSLLPSFKLPIFKGGQLKAQLHEKYADFEEAVHSYTQTLLTALQEIADLLVQAESIGKQIQSQQTVTDSLQQKKELQEALFRTGTANYLSVLDFELEYLNQESTLITLQSNQILIAVKLMKALGGGYQSPVDVPEKFLCQEDE